MKNELDAEKKGWAELKGVSKLPFTLTVLLLTGQVAEIVQVNWGEGGEVRAHQDRCRGVNPTAC